MRSTLSRDILRLLVSAVAAAVAAIAITDAQITVPFPTFTSGTVIQPTEVNANFAKFADALNRTAGTMTGTLTAQQITPATHNTYDLGVTGTRWRDGWFQRNVDIGGTLGATGAVTFGSTLGVTGATTFSNTGASAIDVAGGINAGSGNVGIVGTDGRIPALNATYFASATTATDWTYSGALTAGGAWFQTGVISPSAITADQNDYAPTGFSTAGVVRVSHNNAGGNRSVTGLAGGAAGRTVTLCFISTSSAETFTLVHDSASSTAANRFISPSFADVALGAGECTGLYYDGVTSRWRVQRAGRLPALNSTYVTNLSGANLTGLLEANITDGTVLARVGSAETITQAWAFSSGVGVGGGTTVASIITATTTWDIPSTADGLSSYTFVTMTGVQLSSPCFAGMYINVAGVSKPWHLTAAYSASNQVIVTATNANDGGGAEDPASATLRVTCFTY